jgi:hypothetical protein
MATKTADKATADAAPAEVRNRDMRHTLHPTEVQRVLAEGGTVVHAGNIITKAEDIPDEISAGEAFSEDSPMHPKKVAERRERRRIKAIQEGTWAPPQAADGGEQPSEESAEENGQEAPDYTREEV